MDPVVTLRKLLRQPGVLQVPGCYDAFSARLIECAGYPAAYLGGFGVSGTLLGLPDTGLMSFKEMADRATTVAEALRIPLMADADTGYGNPMNVYRTVQTYARARVAAVQLEDQVWPKRCGHTRGKEVIPLGAAVAKIRAAADARAEDDIVIIARTDARAVFGFDAALERCLAFQEAGADVIFFEAPESKEEMARVADEVNAPVLANMVEGGKTPILAAEELEELGYKVAIYPVTLLLAAAQALRDHLDQRTQTGGFSPWEGQLSFEDLKELVGFREYYRAEERYRG